MTKQEILEREDAQSTTIHLYKEGIFWKAYEYSAYRFVFGILKCKPKKQRFKETSTEMIHIGFPLTSLDTHQDSFRLISKDENTCTIEPVDFLPQMTFEEWKNSIETTVSNNKGANLTSFLCSRPLTTFSCVSTWSANTGAETLDIL